MKLISVPQMIELEKEANLKGMSYDQMMINAGSALAKIIDERYGSSQPKKVCGLIGSGNNGGDTLIAIAKLIEKGWTGTAYLVKGRKAGDSLVSALIDLNCNVIKIEDDKSLEKLRKVIQDTDLILDGILGTGIKLPLGQEISNVLQAISKIEELPDIVAVDCPSGVDCEKGASADMTLHANLTVCMEAVKTGIMKFPAYNYVGEITTVDIGLPGNLKGFLKIQASVVDKEMVQKMLPKRPIDSHKGTFGTCMIVGGSINYCGAVILCARSAYKIGAGLVSAAIPGTIYDAIAGQVPECTWVILPDSLGVIKESGSVIIQNHLKGIDAMLIGPGIGQDKETLKFLEQVLHFNDAPTGKPKIGFPETAHGKGTNDHVEQPAMVFDADALKLLSKIEHWHQLPDKIAVLTPHPGEMAILTGLTIGEIQKDREGTAREFAKKWGHVVVLKGALTVVADPSGNTYTIPIATPALATAGSGDVLAGMITGLLAQGVSAIDAAITGAWLHGQAGIAAEKAIGQNISVMAGDVIEQIPLVLRK